MNEPASEVAFQEAAFRAFPPGQNDVARIAFDELNASVDDSYRKSAEEFHVSGATIRIPVRLHFLEGSSALVDIGRLSIAARCMLTRSTDGRLRQRGLATIIDRPEAWVAPFVATLVGEYVIEIVRDIEAALPRLNSATYGVFARSNPVALRLLRARVTSYWDRYHANRYPLRQTHPGWVVLRQWEAWAEDADLGS